MRFHIESFTKTWSTEIAAPVQDSGTKKPTYFTAVETRNNDKTCNMVDEKRSTSFTLRRRNEWGCNISHGWRHRGQLFYSAQVLGVSYKK